MKPKKPHHHDSAFVPAAGHTVGVGNPRDTAPDHSCDAPKGIDRARCGKADAIVGIFGVLAALILLLVGLGFLIKWCNVQRKKTTKKSDEEDCIELTRHVASGDRGLTPDTLGRIRMSQDQVTKATGTCGKLSRSSSDEQIATPHEQSIGSENSSVDVCMATTAARLSNPMLVNALSSRQDSMNDSQDIFVVADEGCDQDLEQDYNRTDERAPESSGSSSTLHINKDKGEHIDVRDDGASRFSKSQSNLQLVIDQHKEPGSPDGGSFISSRSRESLCSLSGGNAPLDHSRSGWESPDGSELSGGKSWVYRPF